MGERGEAAIRSSFVNRIKNLPEPSWAKVVHGSRFQDAGEPDIDAVIDGVPLKVEVKRPGFDATPIQAAKLRKYRAIGCVTGVASTQEELDELIEECRRKRGRWWGSECTECWNATADSMTCDSCGSSAHTVDMRVFGA